MANWMSGLKQLLLGRRGRRRPIRRQSARKPSRLVPALERLEDRLTPTSTLTVSGGVATFVAAAGKANDLTVSVSGGIYTFKDTGDTISVNGGHAANTVTAAGVTKSLSINLGDGNDIANIESLNVATTVTGGPGTKTINVSSNAPTDTGNLSGIAAGLTVTASNGGSYSLTVSNFSATSGDSNVVVGPSTITGFAGTTNNQTITYNTTSGGSFGLVRLIGSNTPGLAEKFTVNDPNASTFQLDSNAGGDTAIIEGTNSGSTNNINTGAGASTVTVSSDGTTHGSLSSILGTLNINEGSGSGKTLNLIDYGGSGGKSVTVSGAAVTGFATAAINYKAVGGTFSNITLSASNAAGDAFTVTASSPALNLVANGGGDTFVLKNNATVKSIAGGSGADTLTYGSGYTTPVSVKLGSSNANGFSSSSATGITGGFTGIDVVHGTGSSTLTGPASTGYVISWGINAVSANSTVNGLTFSGFSTLDGGSGGGNTFNLQSGAAGYSINGEGGSYANEITGASNAKLSGVGSFGFKGTAANAISFTGVNVLFGSGSLTGENVASTWNVSATVSGGSAYYDNLGNSVTFGGFSTLDGGSGADTFNLASGATGYTLNGGSGNAIDTLTGAANAVLTASSATGFTGTAANSINYTGIDVLDGSGSLTSENTGSTWTVNAVASNSTYSDGAHSLTFSGFSTLDGGSAHGAFNLGAAASGYTINGGTNISDTLTGVSNAVLTSSNGLGFDGTAANAIAFTGIDVLEGSGSLTGDNNVSTWSLYSGSGNYADPRFSFFFSGFTTLDGGTGGNTFNLGAGATGYAINGNTGADTLAGVTNAVLTASGTTGFSGTADNAISFTGFDALDGTGSLTGENVAGAWSLGATQTYSDGAHTLNFSGFDTLSGGTVGDTFNVTAVSAPLTLVGNSSSGADVFNVGSNNSLAGVQSDLTINGAANDTLNVSDTANTTSEAWTITGSTDGTTDTTDIQSGSPGLIAYNVAGGSIINVNVGAPTDGSRNAIDVESLASARVKLTLTSQGNSDVQFAQVGQSLAAMNSANVTVAGASSDTVTLNDQADAANTVYGISDSGVTVDSAGLTVNIPSALGQVIVLGGSGGNTFNVTPSPTTSFTVDGGSSGTNTLNYQASQVSGPADNPQDNDGFSISDGDGYYQTVYYSDFASVNIDGVTPLPAAVLGQAYSQTLSGGAAPSTFTVNPAPSAWTPISSLPLARYLAVVTGKDGTIYAIGGSTGPNQETDEVDAYNPTTGQWTTIAPLPTARYALAAAVGADGTIYAIGGISPGGYRSAEVDAYNPTTGQWTVIAPLPTQRYALAAAVGADGTIYAIGGVDSSGYTAEVDAYNPTTGPNPGQWRKVASLPTARAGLAAAVGADGTIYAIGGGTVSGYTAEVDAYNPTTNQWTTVASLPSAREDLAATTGANGIIYALGGNDGTSSFSEVDAYNPATGIWTAVASLPTTRELPAAATGADGSLYAVGGVGPSGFTSEVDRYMPAGLPSGLTLDSSTGVLSGTPDLVGTSVFTVTVTDANGVSITQTYSLEVQPAQ